MNIEIVQVSGCKRDIVAEVPAEQVDREIEVLARQYVKRAKVPGFRPGKVPMNVVLQRYGADLRSDATQDIIQRCWKQALDDNKLAPLTGPVVKDLKSEAGSPLRFTLSFEVLPEVEVKDYQNVAARLESAPVEEKDVDAALESLRENQAQYVPVESGEISDGHAVTITVDGVFEAGGKPIHEDDVTCVIGSPETNETFSANLRGARPGEERSFDVTYPLEYHRKRFAGKLVHYRVTVKEIKQKLLPELNDDLAKDFGMDGLAQLRDKVRDDLVTKAGRNAEKKAKEEVLDEVVRHNTFDVPDCLVEEELESHARRIANSLARQGIDVDKTHIDWKKVFEEERPEAEKAVRRSIILNAIAKQERIEATEEELEAEFQRLAQGSGKSALALRAQVEKDNKTQSFRERLRQNKALDFIFRNANISRG